MSTADVQVSRDEDGIATLVIASQPLGVMNRETKHLLLDLLTTIQADVGVRVLVVTGKAGVFSVGSDIKEFKSDRVWQAEMADLDQYICDSIEYARFPVIAACGGPTLGGGAELAIACDFRIASRAATFGFPEVKLSAMASSGGTQRLPRIVGHRVARRLLLTGEIISADDAMTIGLVDAVHEDEHLLDEAMAFARQFVPLPALALASAKLAISGPKQGSMNPYEFETLLSVSLGTSRAAAEGQRAFTEKTPPQFQGDVQECLDVLNSMPAAFFPRSRQRTQLAGEK